MALLRLAQLLHHGCAANLFALHAWPRCTTALTRASFSPGRQVMGTARCPLPRPSARACAPCRWRTHHSRRGCRAALLYLGVALWVVWIAASRVYLGLHTPIDLLSGAVAGMAVLVCFIMVEGEHHGRSPVRGPSARIRINTGRGACTRLAWPGRITPGRALSAAPPRPLHRPRAGVAARIALGHPAGGPAQPGTAAAAPTPHEPHPVV